jgi:hypothetical protein
MIRILQKLSEPGGKINEDGFLLMPHFLAVLDGATSLSPMTLDGAWFTDKLIGELAHLTCPSLPERVNAAMEKVRQAFWKESPRETPASFPSAAAIFVLESGPDLEVLAIGDCTGFFALKNGVIVRVRDDTVKRMDQEVLRRCEELRLQTGKSVAQLVRSAEIRALLLQNRAKMNQPKGYRILSFDMRPCSEDDVLRIPARQIRRLALCTDGFDAEQAHLLDNDISLEQLHKRIRRDEADDPEFQNRPRFKSGDDATAVVAEIIP